MKIRTFIQFFIFSILICLYCQTLKAQTKPNVVYILADDMGIGDVSIYNPSGKIRTPNIDKLAQEGSRFNDAHTNSSVCSPTRYGILTGRYSWRGQLKESVTWSYDSCIIESGRLTVASMLKKDGFETACIGKWHLGLGWDTTSTNQYPVNFNAPLRKSPNDFGFDFSYIIPASLDIPPYVYLENGKVTSLPNRETESKAKVGWWRKGPTGADFVHENVLQNFTDKAVDFISTKHDKPFFLYFPLNAPHTPILPTEKWMGKSGLNEYGDFVLMVDDVVGQIVNALKKNNLDQNTIVIFTADNGCSPYNEIKLAEKAGHFSSGNYRGYKADIYEGGHRVPFIVKWPNEIQPNTTTNFTICTTDLMQTLATINKIDVPINSAEDSYDFSHVWNKNGKSVKRNYTIHHSINGTFAIRKGDWKLILSKSSGGWSEPRPEKTIEKGIQLYNLKLDPKEQKDISASNPKKVNELTQLLKKSILEGRSTPGPSQKYYQPAEWDITKILGL